MTSRSAWAIRAWIGAVGIIVLASIALGASWSSSVLLLVLCSAPLGIAHLNGFGAPALTVAELLHDVNAKKDRR